MAQTGLSRIPSAIACKSRCSCPKAGARSVPVRPASLGRHRHRALNFSPVAAEIGDLVLAQSICRFARRRGGRACITCSPELSGRPPRWSPARQAEGHSLNYLLPSRSWSVIATARPSFSGRCTWEPRCARRPKPRHHAGREGVCISPVCPDTTAGPELRCYSSRDDGRSPGWCPWWPCHQPGPRLAGDAAPACSGPGGGFGEAVEKSGQAVNAGR
jgi:hypothetical protein